MLIILLNLLVVFTFSDAANNTKVLNGPSVSRITHNSGLIYIELDQLSNCNLEYWPDKDSRTKTVKLGKKKLINYELKQLKQNTTYNYRFKCSGVIEPAIIGGVFTTNFIFLKEVPKFVSQPKVTRKTANRVTIEWETNIDTSAIIKYGSNELNLSKTLPPLQKQIVELKNLEGGKTYNFLVALHYDGKDIKSDTGKFTTESGTTEAKHLFKLSPTIVKLSANEATIQLETYLPTRTTIYYGVDRPFIEKVENNTFSNEHTVTIKNLKASTNYFYSAEITFKDGKKVVSPVYPFKTEITN